MPKLASFPPEGVYFFLSDPLCVLTDGCPWRGFATLHLAHLWQHSGLRTGKRVLYFGWSVLFFNSFVSLMNPHSEEHNRQTLCQSCLGE